MGGRHPCRLVAAAFAVAAALVPSAGGTVATLDQQLRREPGVLSAIVERDGRILFERYYRGASRGTRLDVFSVTKSVVSTLTGIAVRGGALRLDQRVADFFPLAVRGARDPRTREITVRQLLTMTSGYRDLHITASDDWVETLVRRPLGAPPGRTFSYDNGSYHLMSAVLTKAVGVPAKSYAARVLFRPLGIPTPTWTSDGQGHSLGNTGLRLSARDLLRIGELYLGGGAWHGHSIVPRAYVRAATQSYRGHGYGYGWWVFRYHAIPGFAAIGAEGQAIGVFPSRHLVVVLTGAGSDPGRTLFRIVLPAIDLR